MRKLFLAVFVILFVLPVMASERIVLTEPLPQPVVAQPPQVTDVLFIGLKPSPKDGVVIRAAFQAGYYVPGEVTEENPTPDEQWVRVRKFFVDWTASEWQAKLNSSQRAGVRAFFSSLKSDAAAKVAGVMSTSP